MRISSNYNNYNAFQVKNNVRQNNAKQNSGPSFGKFFYMESVSPEKIAKLFGGQKVVDLLERISDEKKLTVQFANELYRRGKEGSAIWGASVFVIDKTPAKGQQKVKVMHIADERTMPSKLVQEEYEKMQKANPELDKASVLKKLADTVSELQEKKLVERVIDSIIYCRARTTNGLIGAQIAGKEAKKLYGEELATKISDKLMDPTFIQTDALAEATKYNNL